MLELSKNQIHTAKIEGYSSSGAGVCRIGGRAVFVRHALLGETWEVLILKVSRNAVYGKGLRLIEPSPQRRVPPCPVFGACGGCDLMHMSYEEELGFKLNRVNNALKHIAGLDFTIDEILGAGENNIYRYRNKAIFNIALDKNGHVRTGFFRERSHELVPAPNCLIQSELSLRCAKALCAFMDKHKLLPYDEKSGKGLIKNLFVRGSARLPYCLACVVSVKGLGKHTKALVEALKSACPELTGIVLCLNKSSGNTVLAGDFYTLWGSDIIEDELLGLRFKISPQSFYQINPPQTERLYEMVSSYASPDGNSTVLDLYCGAGTISLCLARGARLVYGAEIVESAVLNARENAGANGIKNARFICADAGEAALQLQNEGVFPNCVVVDPPRKGLSEYVIETIVQMSPERVVYVSCDSATLARDIKLFAQKGYSLIKGTAVDMFPRCAHCEVVCMLQRAKK